MTGENKNEGVLGFSSTSPLHTRINVHIRFTIATPNFKDMISLRVQTVLSRLFDPILLEESFPMVQKLSNFIFFVGKSRIPNVTIGSVSTAAEGNVKFIFGTNYNNEMFKLKMC